MIHEAPMQLDEVVSHGLLLLCFRPTEPASHDCCRGPGGAAAQVLGPSDGGSSEQHVGYRAGPLVIDGVRHLCADVTVDHEIGWANEASEAAYAATSGTRGP